MENNKCLCKEAKLEPLYIAGDNVKWYKLFWKTVRRFLKS